MLRTIGTVVILFSLTSVVSAGYTDDLWNHSEDRLYYDCADWSGVHNEKNTALGSHFYWYSKHRRNVECMYDPTNWGYPEGTQLKSVGAEGVAWAAMHIKGFDREIHSEGRTYTDDPSKVNYKTSYLSYSGWWTMYYSVYEVLSDVSKTSIDGVYTVTNRITFKSVYKDDDGDEHYRTTVCSPKDTREYTKWSAINTSVAGNYHNYWTHVVLTLPTPDGATGVKITVSSMNGTSVYERHSHCLKVHQTSEGFNYYDLVEYDYRDFRGIFPCGIDQYVIEYDPEFNVSMIVYSPFEAKEANISMTFSEEPLPEDPSINVHSLIQLAMFLVPMSLTIVLLRRV